MTDRGEDMRVNSTENPQLQLVYSSSKNFQLGP